MKSEHPTDSNQETVKHFKPKMIGVKLNAVEVEQLETMLSSESCEAENASEFVRRLLAREWNRRKGIGKPQAKDYQTAFRNGRPRQPRPKFHCHNCKDGGLMDDGMTCGICGHTNPQRKSDVVVAQLLHVVNNL